jgi:hypothetical protein
MSGNSEKSNRPDPRNWMASGFSTSATRIFLAALPKGDVSYTPFDLSRTTYRIRLPKPKS